MKKTGSLLLLLLLVFTACTVSFAQVTRPQRVPVQSAEFARFQSNEAFTDGAGVFIRWRMVSESGNLGFLVYRIGGTGLEPVYNGIAVTSYGSGTAHPYLGGQYDFFDVQGTLDTAYVVVSRALDGRTLQSAVITPRFSNDMLADTGYTREFLFEHSQWQGGTVVNERPALTRELTATVNASRQIPDPLMQRYASSHAGVKIAVKTEGMYRVTRAELQTAGFPVDSDSSTWRLFMNGNEQSIIVGDGDQYIEFYGRGIDTFETDTRIYYLFQDVVAGKRMISKLINSIGGNVVSNNYRFDAEKKERLSYVIDVLNGEGQNYFGQPIISDPPVTETFTLSGVDPQGPDAFIQVNIQGAANQTHNNPHTVRAVINGVDAGIIDGFAGNHYSVTFVVPASLLHDGVNTLALNTLASNDSSYFDSVKVNFSRKYTANQGRTQFFTPGYRKMDVTGFTSSNIRVFDTTRDGDPQLIDNLPIVQVGATYSVKMPSNRPAVFFAVEESGLLQAASVTLDNPSSLASTDNGADLIIISYSSPEFMAAAESWAAYRRGRTGGEFNVRVVDISDVYDEFSYGTHTSQAIKNFIGYAMSNWHDPKPAYVLLIGDASYDRRNYEGFGNWDMVPTGNVDLLLGETGSDEALADVSVPHDGLADMSIGRIPARTAQSVQTMLNKTMLFELPANQSLSRGSVFPFDMPINYDFEAMSHELASRLPPTMPKTFIARGLPEPNPNRIEDPLAHQNLMNALNMGPFLVSYSGHGSAGIQGSGTFFNSTHAQMLTNANSPSLYNMLTCLNGYFLRPRSTDDSVAEALIKTPNGGAAAAWASTAETTPEYQMIMGAEFNHLLGTGQQTRLGDLIRYSKLTIAGSDAGYSWVLMGDPALKIRQTPGM
jgi:Peptidase family C25